MTGNNARQTVAQKTKGCTRKECSLIFYYVTYSAAYRLIYASSHNREQQFLRHSIISSLQNTTASTTINYFGLIIKFMTQITYF